MNNDTWTHALARMAVRPLLGTGVTPNHLTTLRLLSGLAACCCLAAMPFARDGAGHATTVLGLSLGAWGGLLWIVSAFLDRADGELARIGNMMSPGGHRYDYLVDNGINCLFFLCIGIGLMRAELFGQKLHDWTLLMGTVAAGAMFLCNWMSELYESRVPGERTWSGAWGFHPDDALYLLGPAVWAHLLLPILMGAALGTTVMAAIIALRLLRLPPRPAASVPA